VGQCRSKVASSPLSRLENHARVRAKCRRHGDNLPTADLRRPADPQPSDAFAPARSNSSNSYLCLSLLRTRSRRGVTGDSSGCLSSPRYASRSPPAVGSRMTAVWYNFAIRRLSGNRRDMPRSCRSQERLGTGSVISESAVRGASRNGREAPSSGLRTASAGSSCDNGTPVHFRVLAVFVSGDFCCSALASSTGGALCQGYPARPLA
jgi:hypothetical protein